MRRLSTSQAAKIMYKPLRLMMAVTSTNNAKIKMPPSSRPARRWKSCALACKSAEFHCATLSLAGPTDSIQQTRFCDCPEAPKSMA